MSRCSRCGLVADSGDLTTTGVCPGGAIEKLGCRERELANLRSLLRSVTVNLERAAELLTEDTNITINDVRAAAREIDTVLEVLS